MSQFHVSEQVMTTRINRTVLASRRHAAGCLMGGLFQKAAVEEGREGDALLRSRVRTAVSRPEGQLH